jgi:two-component system response regulator HydG
MASILIAEDDSRIAEKIQSLLAAESHKTVVTRSGEKGIELLRGGQFELLITDIMMEQGTGLDLLEWARANAPNLPILICSSYARPDKLRTHLDGLRYRILNKPFDPDEMLRMVGGLLSERREPPATSP